jgi:hypothetical protein
MNEVVVTHPTIGSNVEEASATTRASLPSASAAIPTTRTPKCTAQQRIHPTLVFNVCMIEYACVSRVAEYF